jgi:N-acetylglucosamine-6-phosphate deacetylase
MKFDIYAGEVYLEEEVLKNGYVTVEEGIIVGVGKKQVSDNLIDMKKYILTPGFVDIHVHGGNGYDTMDGKEESIKNISLYKVKEGVTSFCPTTITASCAKTFKSIECVKKAANSVEGAKIIGVFLEGPFINKEYKGAHPKEFIKEPTLDEIKALISVGGGIIKSVALAPELSNANEIIQYLNSQNINVRIGHSSASYEETNEAIKKGCNIGIHIFNAMKPFNHREPGMVGAMLTNDNVYGEVIVDKVHLHEGAVKLLLKCKGKNKAILITDCINAGGMQDGTYKLGEVDVIVKGKIARNKQGALAGSTLTINGAIKNLLDMGVSLFEGVTMATITPAKALGVDKTIGSIKIGKKADFTAIDRDANVKFVMIDGVRKL